MKIYAKQVPPECQESPLFYDDMLPDNIAVCGNKDYKEHLPDTFKRVREALKNGELAEAIGDIKTGGYYSSFYKNVTEAIYDLLYPEKAKYSTNAIHALKNLIIEYSNCTRSEEDEILCKVLSIITGKKWDHGTIKGCCQSDWQDIYYPVDDWSKEALARFEIEYFDIGTEWIVHDEETDPESPEDISGFSMYCTSWNDEGIKQEIAEASGGKIEDIILYAFDGYTQTAKYKEVAQ